MSSLKDLAQECGVSVATVSKALNGQSDISEATRTRVREAARRMGYVPNMAARSMKTNRTYNIGVLFVDERQSGLAHEYFSAVLDSFKVRVEQLGYDITFINRNLGGKTMTYLEHCHYRGVDGAVIACVDFTDPQVIELVNSDVPVVTIDHVFNNRMAVLSDNVAGLSALVRTAYSQGHRRIAFMASGPPLPRTVWRASSRAAMSWGWKFRMCMCGRASTTTPPAAHRKRKHCWRFRSGPPASSSPMTSLPWAATMPSRRRG